MNRARQIGNNECHGTYIPNDFGHQIAVHINDQAGLSIRKELTACRVERDGFASGLAHVIHASRRRIYDLSMTLSESPRLGVSAIVY